MTATTRIIPALRQHPGTAPVVHCRHCQRPLRAALSVARCCGPVCWRKAHSDARAAA